MAKRVGEIVNFPELANLVRGEESEKAIVETAPRENIVEQPTVNNVKSLVAGRKDEPLTPAQLLDLLKGSEFVSVDLSDDGKHVTVKLDADAIDYLVPVEVPTAKITHEIGESSSTIIVANDVLDADSHYEVIFEIEGTGTHFGSSFTVFPQNASPCFTVGHLDVGGELKEYYATMNGEGQLSILIDGVVLTPESQTTTIFVKKLI